MSSTRSVHSRVYLIVRRVNLIIRTRRRRMTATNRGRITAHFGAVAGGTSRVRVCGCIIRGMTRHFNGATAFVPGPVFNSGNSNVRYRVSLSGGNIGLFTNSGCTNLSRRTLCCVNNMVGRTGTVGTLTGPAAGSCGHLIPNCRTPMVLTCSTHGHSTSVHVPIISSPGTHHVRMHFPSPTTGPCLYFTTLLVTNLSNVGGGVRPNRTVSGGLCSLPPRRTGRVPRITNSLRRTLGRLSLSHRFLGTNNIFASRTVSTCVTLHHRRSSHIHVAPRPMRFRLCCDIW